MTTSTIANSSDATKTEIFQLVVNGNNNAYGQTRGLGTGQGSTPDAPWLNNYIGLTGVYSGQNHAATNLYIGNNSQTGFFYPDSNVIITCKGVVGLTHTDLPGLSINFGTQDATFNGFVDNGAGAGSYTGVAGNTLTVTSVVSGALATGQNVGGVNMINANITAGSGTTWTLDGSAQAVAFVNQPLSLYNMIGVTAKTSAYVWTKKTLTGITATATYSNSISDSTVPVVAVGNYAAFDIDIRASMIGTFPGAAYGLYGIKANVAAFLKATASIDMFEINAYWSNGTGAVPGALILNCLGTSSKLFVTSQSYLEIGML